MSQTFLQQVDEYVALRRRLGTRLVMQAALLRDFSRFLDGTGHVGPITAELALDWARAPRSKDPDQTARRLSVIRGFLRHRAGFDQATEIPPPDLLGSGIRRKPPHIYSEAEVKALLQQCAELRPRNGLRAHTYRTLFCLLFASGLRISEALHLDDVDVDLVEGVMTVRHGKFGKSRLVPLHATALVPLRRYVARRDATAPPSDAFFRTDRHTRLSYTEVRMTFGRMRSRLGWTSEGRARRPRVHDTRHTFAATCLLRWYREGVQLDHRIAHLATYLGHVEVRDTYWYLTAVPSLAALASRRFESFAKNDRRVDR